MSGRHIISLAMIFLLVGSIPLMLLDESTGARSGSYPTNYNMQDYEPSPDDQWDLDVAQQDDGKFLAVWADDRQDQDFGHHIRFSKSQNGTSWGDGYFNNNDIIVNSDAGDGNNRWHPTITTDDQPRIFCTWLDDGAPEPRLMISTSNNTGIIWTTAKEITAINGTISEPMIRWSPTAGLIIVYSLEKNMNGTVHRDIMMIRSTDGGETFSSPRRLNDDETDEDQVHPQIIVSGTGRMAIVWEDYRNGDSISRRNSDIFMVVTDNGLTFSENIRIGSPDDEQQQYPDGAFSASNDLMIVWQESTLNGWRSRYSIGWNVKGSLELNMTNDQSVVSENLTIRDEFAPKAGYVDGAFVVSWTSVDSRDFYLIRTGYLSRLGDTVSGDHIVDNTIALGKFINDPDIFIAEMVKETVAVLGDGAKAQVFWLDRRTDPNPSNDKAEDSDPYTARAKQDYTMPKKPLALPVRIKDLKWDQATIEWDISPDIEFKGYYLTIQDEEVPSLPDQNLNNGSSTDRLVTEFIFKGLEPDTEYFVRLMTLDRMGKRSDSPPISFRTGVNLDPVFTFDSPDGIADEADLGFEISWFCSDPEEVATFTLHYDTDLDPAGQVFLYSGTTSQGNGYGSYYWNTSGIPQGGYTINATIDDGVNDPVTVYSHAIIVTHRTIVLDHPRILTASVEGGKETAFTDPEIWVTFSKPMSGVSINDESVYLIGPMNKRVEGSIIMNGNDSFRWIPEERLGFGEEYRMVLLAEIVDMEGIALDGENIGRPSTYNFIFNTRSDGGIPQVREWIPQGSDVSLRPEIVIVFDIPVSDSTVNEFTAILEGPDGKIIPTEITPDEDGITYRIIPSRPLEENTAYTMNLSSNITSLRGQNLGEPFEWGFTTGTANLGVDSDGDDVPDDLDMFPDDPTEAYDMDEDGIGDNLDLDDDGDGMSDIWEERYGLDPKNPGDAGLDNDDDGKTNLEEYNDQTDPLSSGDDDSSLGAFLLVVGIGLVIVIILLVYALFLRSRLEEDKAKKDFFREE